MEHYIKITSTNAAEKIKYQTWQHVEEEVDAMVCVVQLLSHVIEEIVTSEHCRGSSEIHHHDEEKEEVSRGGQYQKPECH